VNIGSENRTKLIAAICLGAVALIVIVIEFGGWFSGSSSSAAAPVAQGTSVSDPIPTPTVKTRTKGRAANSKKETARDLDPRLQFALLNSSEETKYEGTGRNIFKVFVVIPPLAKNPVADTKPEPPVTPQPAPPPPIDLKFYGFATPQGGAKRVFLAHGEDIFVAKEGEIVNRRYKVVRISPNAVEILDVLSNNRQSITLTQG
jgi:hypothetical protein